MRKQKKITEKAEVEEEEGYQTPLETLLSFLHLPHKIYRDIYVSILERRLSSKPLVQNAGTNAFLAQCAGIEPTLIAEKIRSMVNMKWIEMEEVGKRQSNQIFILSPVWRYKSGIDEGKFALALRDYRAAIVEDTEHKMSTEEIYTLMNSVCPHTSTKVDPTLCEMGRWDKCKTCSHRRECAK